MLSHIIPAPNECLQRKELQNEYGMRVILNIRYSHQFKTMLYLLDLPCPLFQKALPKEI